MIYLPAACSGTSLVPGESWVMIDTLPGRQPDRTCHLEFEVYGPEDGAILKWHETCGRNDLPDRLIFMHHTRWGTIYDVKPGGWWYVRPGAEIWNELWCMDEGSPISHEYLEPMAVVPIVREEDLDDVPSPEELEVSGG